MRRWLLLISTLLLLLCGCSRPPEPVSQRTPLEATPAPSATVASTPEAITDDAQEEPAWLNAAVPSGKSEAIEPPRLNDTPVTVQASLQPLQGVDLEALRSTPVGEELSRLTVNLPETTYASSEFDVFLPDHPVKVGETWKLQAGVADRFLKQLHHEMGEKMKGGRDAEGSFALLRARSETHLDILLRLHAQFWLADSLSITPGQLAGRLVVDRARGAVAYFQLTVPTEHERNVNFEWKGEGTPLVGMVFTPEMRLQGGELSDLSPAWSEAVSSEQAREVLAREFFAFESLDWLPPEEALAKAREQGRPIFAITIEGVLTDQSC